MYVCAEWRPGGTLSQIWEELDEEQVEAVIYQVLGVTMVFIKNLGR